MREVLKYLVDSAAFLYEVCGCRIVGSASWDKTGKVLLQNETMNISIESDSARIIVIEVWPLEEEKTLGISIDILRTLVSGEIRDVGEMDEANTLFLQEHFEEISEMFRPGQVSATMKTCERLKKERGDRLF